MKKTSIYLKNYILLFGCICLVIFVYWKGLSGGFIFDDYPNLAGLAQISHAHDWHAIQDFVFSGGAGPTGRPISLLTFALEALSWPNDSFSFKLINLTIHIGCGLLLYWVSKLILRSYGIEQQKSHWIALLSCSIWLLHPFFVSTTLYVIQRMAQLSTLFSLMGIVGYLKGRATLSDKPIHAYLIMTCSVGIGTILATCSKENGALLPLLILIIEFCNPRQSNKPILYWRFIFLWLPSIAIALLLFHYVDFSKNPWPERNFNQIQRLWSESRIVCSYLYQLFVPRIEGYGLFQDGYQVSKGWFQPITTIFSVIFLTILFILSFVFRKKYPLFSLAILFFFAAHLIESTVVGLELYFEHRNYAAALFLFLPLAAGIVGLYEKINPRLATIVVVLIIFLLSFMTWQRSNLWSNIDKLQIYWAQRNLDSNRAQTTYAKILWQYKQYSDANTVLERALQKHPSATVALQLLNQEMQLHLATAADLHDVQTILENQKINGEVTWQLRSLVTTVVDDPEIAKNYAFQILQLIKNVTEKNKGINPDFPALTMLLQGQLNSSLNQQYQAYLCYQKATLLYNDLNASLAVVTDFANRGDKILALKLLSDVEQHYKKQLVGNIAMQKAAARLREAIQHDIQSKKG